MSKPPSPTTKNTPPRPLGPAILGAINDLLGRDVTPDQAASELDSIYSPDESRRAQAIVRMFADRRPA